MELPVLADFFLNCWHLSGGVSKTTPPRQTLSGVQLDSRKHCKFKFGECVIAHTKSDRTMEPRGECAIDL